MDGWLRGRRISGDHLKQRRFKDVVCRTRNRHLPKRTVKKREKQKKTTLQARATTGNDILLQKPDLKRNAVKNQ